MSLVAPLRGCPPLLTPEDVLRRPCKSGELCRPAAVSRPDICARLTRIASEVNPLQGSDVYRVNDLIKTAHVRQPAAVLKYACSSHANEPAREDVDGRVRARGGEMHGGATSLVGRAHVAFGVCQRKAGVALGISLD